MRDAGVCPSGDLHSLQVAAEPLDRRQLNRPVSSRPRADERAVNVPEEEAFFY